MARWGDVGKRVSYINPDDWPWAVTDCYEWSRSFFTDLLCNKKILSGEGSLHMTTGKTLDKFDGEACVYVRKVDGEVSPSYDLEFALSYEAEIRDDDGVNVLLKTEGSLEILGLIDENTYDEVEFGITVRDEGPLPKKLEEAYLKKVEPFLHETVMAFADAMAKGGAARDDAESRKIVAAFETIAIGSSDIGSSVEMVEEKGREGFRTIRMSEKFTCRAMVLYRILMDENRWKGFTKSNAWISKEVGGGFSVFDGSVTGQTVALVVGKLIVQKWRFVSWPDGVVSTVHLTLDEPESGGSVVKLTHIGVPEEDRYGNTSVVEDTERGWRDVVFHNIRAVFGL